MEQNSSPISRAGALTALGGSALVVTSMFMPWVERGSAGSLDYFHLAGVAGVASDRGAWEVSLVLMLALLAWCAVYFVWRSLEARMAWAFGGFTGAMMLYGSDMRISADIPAGSFGSGELVAAIGLLVLLVGSIFAVSGNIADSNRAVASGAGRS